MVNEAKLEVGSTNTLAELQEIRVKYLGKKGLLTNELKTLGNLTPDDRKIRGQALNIIKNELEGLFDARESDLKNADLERKLSSEAVDVTLPGIPFPTGGYHLITRIIDDLADIYKGMGYGVVQGPEVETEHYNFDALNIPGWHPARDLWDTFWLTDNRVLRTHTSPMQARFMQAFEPPLKIVVPGKVYRFEQVDATHEAMFHQLEGLAVGPNITMSDLKGTLTEMGKALFGPNAKIRFQPSYYPFTEPSADFAIYWEKEDRWLELGGSGMVHPRVFEEVSKLRGDTVYVGARGFAFGLGIERLAMIKYRIPDIRYFFQNDLRVLRQFRGALGGPPPGPPTARPRPPLARGFFGGWFGLGFQVDLNLKTDGSEVVHDFGVGKTNYPQTEGLEALGSSGISSDAVRGVVLRAIEFNHKFSRGAIKI